MPDDKTTPDGGKGKRRPVDDGTGCPCPDEADLRENICRRCGVCCHEKVRFGEQVVITDIPCPFLDETTNRCTVYPDRLTRQPRCSSAEDSVKANSLPDDCPYVGGRTDYQPAHLLTEHPEYEQAVNTLFPERRRGRKCGKST